MPRFADTVRQLLPTATSAHVRDCFSIDARNGGELPGDRARNQSRDPRHSVTDTRRATESAMKYLRVSAAAVVLSMPIVAFAADAQPRQTPLGCGDLFRIPGLVYRGTAPTMTLQDLASYAAPVFWLS